MEGGFTEKLKEIQTKMEGSSSSQDARVTEYPYPSNLSAASFVSVKLSGRDNYHMWEAQMRCLLESHGMFGFVTGEIYYYSAVQEGGESYALWRRSNAVVKGWILGSLTEETLRYVMYCLKKEIHQRGVPVDFDARSLWNELRIIFNPRPIVDLPEPQRTIDEVHEKLGRAILAGNWDEVSTILRRGDVTMFDNITNNGYTALHVAASTTKKPKVLQKLLEMISEGINYNGWSNDEGNTPHHVAAIVGNFKAVEILVKHNANLLLTKNNNRQTPLAIALSNMDTKMSKFLLQSTNLYRNTDARFSSKSADELLAILISCKDFRFAYSLLERYYILTDSTVLMALAQNFPNELNIVEKYLGTSIMGDRVKDVLNSVRDDMSKTCVPFCGSWVETLFWLMFVGIYGVIMFIPLILKMLAWFFIKKRVQTNDHAMQLLSVVCQLIQGSRWSESRRYYENPIIEATGQNAYQVVEAIVRFFPRAISTTNQDDHNIIQYAVINRSEKVYNLLYQMSELKNVYRTIKDPYQNNLLHLAGRLAPTNKLDLISGAFLQIQRELQWFKEVQGFVSPLNAKQKNFFNETPQMVFTREHRELAIEGERWLKATAESYTITAALITTVMFAAAITVPGGNNQDTGVPMFTNNLAFTVFAISDAISLFASITSLLMFLSILTARFAEQDFLFKLPTKLIIGLGTLFISTTAMIVASGATLHLVFGQKNTKILITIIVFTCLPIAAFVTLQSRLIIDLMGATYGRSIFGKKRDRPFC